MISKLLRYCIIPVLFIASTVNAIIYPYNISCEDPIDMQCHTVTTSTGCKRMVGQFVRANCTELPVLDLMVTWFPNGQSFVELQTIPAGGAYICQTSTNPLCQPGTYIMTRLQILIYQDDTPPYFEMESFTLTIP